MKYKGNELVCLIPREGKSGITSHEKTLCDCEVIEILEQLKEANKVILRVDKLYNLLMIDTEIQQYLKKYGVKSE